MTCFQQLGVQRAGLIRRLVLLVSLSSSMMILASANAAEPSFVFVEHPEGKLVILLNDQKIATYVYRDEVVSHPYFADVRTRTGDQVTRQHPPHPRQDAVDHVGLHTGIWLSFGDLNGYDYWRLKARTEHVRFVTEPEVQAGSAHFTVLNRYLSSDGQSTACEETCKYTIKPIPTGYVIEYDSEFRPGQSDLVFGDQEEMGLGIRLATPLAVDRKAGGRILDSVGRRNGGEVWGKTAEWCDYSGPLEGQWVGMTVLTGPENFRPCWSHARDYGFLTMNPFGRNAFTKQGPSRVVVKPGEVLKLRFGVAVHSSKKEGDFNPDDVYREFAKLKDAKKVE